MAENTNVPAEKYLIFFVCEKRCALPSRIISEVAVLEKVFPLPLVPDYVRGIINRYSIPYALIDINALLFNDVSQAKKVIVLKEEFDKLALLIDDVADIADVPPEKLMDTGAEENADGGESQAGGSGSVNAYFEWKGNPVLCLDAGEIISRIKNDFEQKS